MAKVKKYSEINVYGIYDRIKFFHEHNVNAGTMEGLKLLRKEKVSNKKVVTIWTDTDMILEFQILQEQALIETLQEVLKNA